ncbi:hypothetical protein ACFM35_00145 [Microbacterium sp. P01]|uniref:hypothetical protein n=1 Tax=Microbacterium sp. P01 TaxID=3366261 RepID=UPI00366FC87C
MQYVGGFRREDAEMASYIINDDSCCPFELAGANTVRDSEGVLYFTNEKAGKSETVFIMSASAVRKIVRVDDA